MASLSLHSRIWQFTTAIYNQLHSSVEDDQNIILSPLSIHLTLTLSLMGAGGTTASEIASGLALADFDHTIIQEKYQKLISSMDKQFKLANKTFFMTGHALRIAFNNVVTKQFMSEIEEVNFANSSSAADIINNWIDSKTNHRLQNCIASNELDSLTRLVLVNTVYLKCEWAEKFDCASTKKQQFFHSETESAQVDMMWQETTFPFCEIKALDCDAIKLRYNKSYLSMVILLPNSRTGLDSLNSKLKNTSFPEIFQQIESEENVSLSLPKFGAKLELDLEVVLKKIGMTSMFDQDLADFSGMFQNSQKRGIFVTSIKHYAFIDVTENGTEAGALTKMILSTYGPKLEPVPFIADHPFRFFIIDPENLVLFDGCFRNASEDKSK